MRIRAHIKTLHDSDQFGNDDRQKYGALNMKITEAKIATKEVDVAGFRIRIDFPSFALDSPSMTHVPSGFL